jgi:hypothetical protein
MPEVEVEVRTDVLSRSHFDNPRKASFAARKRLEGLAVFLAPKVLRPFCYG